MSDIFISYSRRNQDVAALYAKALADEGWSVWWDPQVLAGDTFDEVIQHALDSAKCVLVLWSTVSTKSRWVKAEATVALAKGVVVPAFIETVEPPLPFSLVQTIDLVHWNGSRDAAAFRELVAAIARSAGDPARRVEPGQVLRDRLALGGNGPELVVIPSGTFEMGDAQNVGLENETPVRGVRVGVPFGLGRYPVTFAEYDAFAEGTHRNLPRDEGWGRGTRPVVNVTWDDAVAYVAWLSQQTGEAYRLASEAEWEYAARGGGRSDLWSGTSSETGLGEYAWFLENSRGQTQPVGQRRANTFGIQDMSGNVWEWVRDVWTNGHSGAPVDGSATTTGDRSCRVVRGGSWLSPPEDVRSSRRSWLRVMDRAHFVGFRVARSV